MDNNNELFKTFLDRYNDIRTIEVKYNILVDYIRTQEEKASYFDSERLYELVNILEKGVAKGIEKKV